jgi:hypothetical protein
LPLIEMDKFADFKITSIQLQNFSLNPKDLRTFKIKDHSKVSKALVMSIFKAKLPPKDLL